MLYLNSGAAPRCTVEHFHAGDDAVWLDLIAPTDEERSVAERLSRLRVPSREDLTEIETSSRIYTEDGALYFSMPFTFRVGDHHAEVTPAGFVLSGSHLLTLRFAALPAFDTFAERFVHAAQPTAPEAFVGLTEVIVDRVADVMERMAAELDRLSKATFQSGGADDNPRGARRADKALRSILGSIGRCGDSLGHLRDSVLTLGRIVAYLQQTDAPWFPADLKPRLATLRQDIASLNDYDQQLNAKVSFLLDAVLGFINIEQNNGVKVLTVVSVVGIPPTFVVGLYGMNFKGMPEYDWTYGYEYGWALILLSVVVPLVCFRIKGWI